MIVLFTDFGFGGPYTGQVKAVLELPPGWRKTDLSWRQSILKEKKLPD